MSLSAPAGRGVLLDVKLQPPDVNQVPGRCYEVVKSCRRLFGVWIAAYISFNGGG